MTSEREFDRLPPQNVEAEQAVLGAILLDGEALVSVQERISQDDFYRTSHRLIFEAMVELSEEGEPVDLVTLAAKLKDKQQLEEAGGARSLY